MYATEKQNRGSDCSLIVVSLTTENNNRIIHIRKAADFTFLLQTFCNLLYWLYLINGMDNGLEDGMDYGLEDGTCNETVTSPLLSFFLIVS